jgi:hypothetical protein
MPTISPFAYNNIFFNGTAVMLSYYFYPHWYMLKVTGASNHHLTYGLPVKGTVLTIPGTPSAPIEVSSSDALSDTEANVYDVDLFNK